MTRHILVAVGMSHSDAALMLAIERARELDARLTALHVVDRVPAWITSSIGHDCGQALAFIDERANSIAMQSVETMHAAGIEGRCMMIDLPARTTLSRVIARAARELDADLIVIGRSARAGWRFWEERVSDAVSRHSNRRVLIAADDGAPAASEPETKATPFGYTIVGSTQRQFAPID
jgi:nucleotide-binding universal stress UspA family protein